MIYSKSEKKRQINFKTKDLQSTNRIKTLQSIKIKR